MFQLNGKSVVVCVQNPNHCGKLIETGKKIAGVAGTQLQIIHIQPQNGEKDAKTLEELYQISKEAQAELTVFFSDNPVATAAVYLEEHNAIQVVTGMPDMERTGFVDLLRQLVPHITFSMVSEQGITYNMYPQFSGVSKR